MEIIFFKIYMETILYGIIAGFIANYFWSKYSIIFPIFNTNDDDLKGIWIGKIPYKFKKNNKDLAINLFKFSGNKNNLKVQIEHYYFNGETYINRKAKGKGIFNSSNVNVVYKFNNKESNQSGTFIARLQTGITGKILKGNYSQFFDMKNKHDSNIKLISENYTLYKINPSFKNQIRTFFGKFHYNNYSVILNKLNYVKNSEKKNNKNK